MITYMHNNGLTWPDGSSVPVASTRLLNMSRRNQMTTLTAVSWILLSWPGIARLSSQIRLLPRLLLSMRIGEFLDLGAAQQAVS